MVKLFIIADDFTGALDTGVQFCSNGIRTKVLIGSRFDIREGEEYEVLVMDTETRHIASEKAYQVVRDIVTDAVRAGIPHIYKKTDSALRGNIGSELRAALDASRTSCLSFFPAFPQMDRITKDGVHYINGVPVSQSVFGQDPFEPVIYDDVAKIILSQGDTLVRNEKDLPEGDLEGIVIYDGISEDEMSEKIRALSLKGADRCMAGCAGLAGLLPDLLSFQKSNIKKENLPKKLVFICGSVNPITQKQIETAEREGVPRITLSPRQRLENGWWKGKEGEKLMDAIVQKISSHECIIIDGNDPPGSDATMVYAKENQLTLEKMRVGITKAFGCISRQLLQEVPDAAFLISGGDTLLGLMEELGSNELIPICEIAPGSVLTRLHWDGKDYHIISKSGGFGSEQLIKEILDQLKR